MTAKQQEVADWLASVGLEVYTRNLMEQVPGGAQAKVWGTLVVLTAGPGRGGVW